jgi:predicted ATPase
MIDDLVKKGSQFIIATHSPILISYRNGKILDLNNSFNEIDYKDTDIYNLYKMYLEDSDGMQNRLFDE